MIDWYLTHHIQETAQADIYGFLQDLNHGKIKGNTEYELDHWHFPWLQIRLGYEALG